MFTLNTAPKPDAATPMLHCEYGVLLVMCCVELSFEPNTYLGVMTILISLFVQDKFHIKRSESYLLYLSLIILHQ